MGVENGMYEGVALAKNIQDPKKKAHFTYSVDVPEDNQGSSSKNDSSNGTRPEQNRGRKGKFFKNSDKHLPSGPQQKGDFQERPKHINWSRDRKFTPLDQPLEKVLEYLLSHGMVKLPKIADPPVIMGKYREQYCKFHRAMGHDTEHCFVLKHLVQDCIDKSILVEDEEEGKLEILSASFPKHSTSTISEHSFLPQSHIHPCSSEELNLQHQVMVLHQDQPVSQKMDIFSLLNQVSIPIENGRTQIFPRRFLKKEACGEEAETSEAAEERAKSLQKPITALSNISIFELTHDSPQHREKLEDLLRKIKVKSGITPEDMAQIVNQAMTNAPITFSDKDLPKPHSFHNNALYIVVRTRGMTVPHVLVDGGSSLNICPEMTAKALGLKEEEYVPDPITIYGFDNHGQTAKGKIFLEIFINYSVHTVLFHVVNVPPTYNLLLG